MKKIVMSILGITMMACTMVNATAQPQISINMNRPQIGYLYDTPNYHFAYIGNFRSMKLHLSECRYASSISRHNLIGFGSRDTAIEMGFVPCRYCNP